MTDVIIKLHFYVHIQPPSTVEVVDALIEQSGAPEKGAKKPSVVLLRFFLPEIQISFLLRKTTVRDISIRGSLRSRIIVAQFSLSYHLIDQISSGVGKPVCLAFASLLLPFFRLRFANRIAYCLILL